MPAAVGVLSQARTSRRATVLRGDDLRLEHRSVFEQRAVVDLGKSGLESVKAAADAADGDRGTVTADSLPAGT